MTPASPAPPAWPADALRVLDTGAGLPAWNMALDEALLRSAGPPTLRLYRWSPPGLSLGRFQSKAAFADVRGPHHVVRRCTGGGAIYHDDEITFALTLRAALLPVDVAASYVLLHTAVQRALATVGVDTDLVAVGPAPSGRARAGFCFAGAGPHDLVLRANRRKIVGSAQRRIRVPDSRVLHHGSIVLRAPAPTPFCGAVADVADPRAVESALRHALIEVLAAAVGLHSRPTTSATAEELDAARRIQAEHAGSDEVAGG